MDFRGKVALITSASGGVGREVAIRLAQAGADVVVHSGTETEELERLTAQIREMGRRAISAVADIRRKAEVEGMVERARRELGPVSVLVMCEQEFIARDFLEATVDDWDLMWGTYLKGNFLVTQAVCRQMRESGGGSIVLLSSACANKVTDPDLALFASARAGQTMYAKSLAFSLAGENIRANAVVAGPLPHDPLTPGTQAGEEFLQTIPQKRLGTAGEIANACLFLASEEVPFVTGCTLLADGGYTLATTGASRPRVQKS